MIDEILEKVGLKYEDLSVEEKETLNTMLSALDKGNLTLTNLKDYFTHLRETVENQLIDEPEFNYIFIFKVPNRKQIYLKARLRNLMLLEAFLSTPEKARKAVDRMLAGMVK